MKSYINKAVSLLPASAGALCALVGITLVILQWYYGFFNAFDTRVRLLIFGSALMFIPGNQLYSLISGQRDSMATLIPVSFVFSLLIFMPLALAAYIFQFTVPALILLYCGASLLMGMAKIVFPSLPSGKSLFASLKSEKKYFTAGVFILAFIGMIAGVYFGCWIFGDFFHHMPAIRKLLELPRITFANYTLKELPLPVYGHNVWYLFVALLSAVCHSDPTSVWIYSPMLIVPLKVLAFYLASRAFFDSERVSFLSTAVFFLAEAVMTYGFASGFHIWTEAAYPSHIARDIVVNVTLAFVFVYLKTRRTLYLFLLPFLGALTAFVHMYYILLLCFVLASCLPLVWLLRREIAGDLVKALAAVMVIGLPYALVYSRLLSHPLINSFFVSPQNMLWDNPVHYILGKYPIFNPFMTVLANPLRIAVMLCVPFLFLRLRKGGLPQLYLLSVSGAILFILFNPAVLHLLQKVNPALDRIYRIVEVFPVYWTAGYFWGKFLESPSPAQKIVGRWGAGAVIVVALCFGAVRLTRAEYNSAYMLSVMNNFLKLKTLAQPHLPAGSIVAIPESESRIFLILFPCYPVAVNSNLYLPPNYDQIERVTMQRRFFSEEFTEESFRFLDYYKVDYVWFKPKRNPASPGNRFVPALVTGEWGIYRYQK